MQMLTAQGHTGFKAKVGGLALAEDMKRLEVVFDVIGADKELMVDVNRGWDLATATEAAGLLRTFRLRWLEEPVRWIDDRRELKLLVATDAHSAGRRRERAHEPWLPRAVEEHAVQILQFDCTMFGASRRVVQARGVAMNWNHGQVAPHHDCFIHAPLVASTPAGCIVESFTDPERDPFRPNCSRIPPRIADGWLTLS